MPIKAALASLIPINTLQNTSYIIAVAGLMRHNIVLA